MTTTHFFQRTALIAALTLTTTAQAITVVEYYNKSLDAYFLTGRAAEQTAVDAVADFQRTGMTFQADAIASATPAMTPICRFYIAGTTPFLSSHFYGRKGAECEDLRAKNIAGFTWEDFDFAVQESASGVCAAGTTTVYRSFRTGTGGKTSNHRYTASTATYNAAAAAGYVGEGPVFCVSAATPATATTGGSAFTSAVGAATGAPVSQSITAAGGKIIAGGITVRAPKNEFASSATVTVQPIADTLNGSGTALQISSSTPWRNALVVSFPITAADGNPDNINLALQNDDGSWTVLGSVADAATSTVTALIPPSAPLSASAVGSDHTKASSSTGIRVGKLRNLIFTPAAATVKPGASVAFSAYARVDIENYDPQFKSPACARYREAVRVAEAAEAAGGVDVPFPQASSACNAPVIRDLPFTNDKPGFTREWSLDGPGTLVAGGGSGATYTAPGVKPSPNVARVNFTSKNLATTASVLMWAPVTITDVVKTYRGSFRSGQQAIAFNGTVTWSLEDTKDDVSIYRVTAVNANLTGNIGSDCTALPGAVTVESQSFLRVKSNAPNGANTSVNYGGAILSAPVSITCKNGDSTVVVPFSYAWFTCNGDGNDPFPEFAPSAIRLQGSCSVPSAGATGEWDFIAVD